MGLMLGRLRLSVGGRGLSVIMLPMEAQYKFMMEQEISKLVLGPIVQKIGNKRNRKVIKNRKPVK